MIISFYLYSYDLQALLKQEVRSICVSYYDLYMWHICIYGPNTVHPRHVWKYNMFYINISIYAPFKYLFYKTKNHLVIRQCLVEEAIFLNKDIIGLKSKIVQFQLSQLILFNTNFFASSTKIATLHCQFVIHMTQCLGNVFFQTLLIFQVLSFAFCIEYITPMCGKNKISQQRFGRKTNSVVEYWNTIEKCCYFVEKQSFGLTVQILNQRYFYRPLHKKYSSPNLHWVWSLNQFCDSQWMCWCPPIKRRPPFKALLRVWHF